MFLFQDLQREAFLQLHARGAQDRANGPRGSSLLADHLPEVRRVNAQFQHGDLLTLHGPDLNLIRIVHKRLGDGFDELLHLALPFNRVVRNHHKEKVRP